MSAPKKDALQEPGGVTPVHTGLPWAVEIRVASVAVAAGSTALEPVTNLA